MLTFQAEEENKKRKIAQAALNKSTGPAFKKVGALAGSSGLQSKPKEPLRSIKPVIPTPVIASSSNGIPVAGGSKLGPTAFRTAETTTTSTTTVVATHGTMSLVQPRAALGPPSRPSSQLPQPHAYPTFQPQMHGQHGMSTQAKPAVVLQQSRIQLQTQLDEKALEIQSEDIVLPDIASEYVTPTRQTLNSNSYAHFIGIPIQTIQIKKPISNHLNGPNHLISERHLRLKHIPTPTRSLDLSSLSIWRNCLNSERASLGLGHLRRIGMGEIGSRGLKR